MTPSTLGVILAALTIASVLGAAWAVFRAATITTTVNRLREENEDYIRRLTYLEPHMRELEAKVAALERENGTLRDLLGAADAIQKLQDQEQRNHMEAITMLRQIARNGNPS